MSHHYQTFLFSGVPGVGKTSIIESIAQKFQLPIYNFGDVLFKLVKKHHPDIKKVDEIRLKLNSDDYNEMQTLAAMEIATHNNENKIIVSHLSIATPTGFMPGFPRRVTEIIQPTIVFIIEAPAAEIAIRRKTDNTRQRGNNLENLIEFQQSCNRSLGAAYAFTSGCHVYPIINQQGNIESAINQAQEIMAALLNQS